MIGCPAKGVWTLSTPCTRALVGPAFAVLFWNLRWYIHASQRSVGHDVLHYRESFRSSFFLLTSVHAPRLRFRHDQRATQARLPRVAAARTTSRAISTWRYDVRGSVRD